MSDDKDRPLYDDMIKRLRSPEFNDDLKKHMADKDLNEKNVERICQDEMTRRLLNQIINKILILPKRTPQQMRPHMRPHTFCFLRERNLDTKEDSYTCLGVVFKTWDDAKFNMLRFSATVNGERITETAVFSNLDSGERGLVVKRRWQWETLLSEYKGLSAGDL